MIRARTTKAGERRYDARVRTPDGRVLTRTFRRKKDAEAWEAQQLADWARGNLSGVTIHDLRRGAATVMTRITDVKTLQSRLGHVDPRLSIGLYAQFTSVADQAAAGALEALFFGPSVARSPRDAAEGEPPDAKQPRYETGADGQRRVVEVSGFEPPTSTLRT